MSQPWKLILALVGIFAAGVVTGAFVTQRVIREMVARPRPLPEQWIPQRLERLAKRLELTPEQVEQLRPLMKRNMEELNQLRNYSMQGTRNILERMQREVTDKLTPEQRAKFEQMNREEREKREERDKAERARRAGGDRPNDGPRPMGEPGRPPGPKPPPSPDKPPGT